MILDNTETVATFTVDGDDQPYEIDHLGITDATQWGHYTVYRRGKQLAAFVVPVPAPRPRNRPAPEPASGAELIELARAALAPGDQ
jgi:hypothetical protein